MQNGNSIQKSKSSPPIVIPDDFEGYPLESFRITPNLSKYLQSVLIPGGFIQDRVERLACDIAADLGNEPFTALCVLKGGYLFFNNLLEKIRQLHRYRLLDNPELQDEAQQIKVEFIRLKSYENTSSTNQIQVIGIESLETLRGRNVLIVEDIIDTGRTMVKLLDLLEQYEPRTIRVTSLLVKRTPLSNGYMPKYTGFSIPNKFIVGCNMDYNEYFRDLNHLCVMNEYGKQKYSSSNR
ncbi:hypoxanthine-guanine phosphoribosyltransferase [Dermatophagoides farinae]|uniref:Hypoxanthine phosphoribosyltransferase n=1 Tax=Dermatophagoides farinae TaxID=6954 RepID=A0A922HU07_DERFA|nr:hypoxanthine-guanine phosphoribosyltransferase-like [Dermatophagoides farinae]KAH7642779.1 hypoxanthine-guanine phosphoribosyltransferase-like protein [Dermatophagoides farinae]KAH9506219.1 hypoxanthine phosphoribosyltransferase 1 [Dermatophagoides farinae]